MKLVDSVQWIVLVRCILAPVDQYSVRVVTHQNKVVNYEPTWKVDVRAKYFV